MTTWHWRCVLPMRRPQESHTQRVERVAKLRPTRTCPAPFGVLWGQIWRSKHGCPLRPVWKQVAAVSVYVKVFKCLFSEATLRHKLRNSPPLPKLHMEFKRKHPCKGAVCANRVSSLRVSAVFQLCSPPLQSSMPRIGCHNSC